MEKEEENAFFSEKRFSEKEFSIRHGRMPRNTAGVPILRRTEKGVIVVCRHLGIYSGRSGIYLTENGIRFACHYYDGKGSCGGPSEMDYIEFEEA